jgi:hypothetical protein
MPRRPAYLEAKLTNFEFREKGDVIWQHTKFALFARGDNNLHLLTQYSLLGRHNL